MRRVLPTTLLVALVLLSVPAQSALAEDGITLSGGNVSSSVSQYETKLFASLTLQSIPTAEDGVYNLSGETNAPDYRGTMSGTYNEITGQFSGQYSYFMYDDMGRQECKSPETDAEVLAWAAGGAPDWTEFTSQGTFKGEVDVAGECELTLTGTMTTTHHNYAIEPFPSYKIIYPDGIESQTTTDVTRTVTFSTSGKALPTVEKWESKDSGIRFSTLKGTVEMTPQVDKSGWRVVQKGKVIPPGTLIRTSADSSLILTLPDSTTFELGPNSILLISDPAMDNYYGLQQGEMKATVKRLGQDPTLEIDMDESVCVVQGTTLVVKQDDTTSTLKVIEGTVEFTAKVDGKTEMVSTGEVCSATKDGLGEVKTFDVDAEQAFWDDLGLEKEGGLPLFWLIILIIVVAAIILAAVILVIKHSKSKKAYAQ